MYVFIIKKDNFAREMVKTIFLILYVSASHINTVR